MLSYHSKQRQGLVARVKVGQYLAILGNELGVPGGRDGGSLTPRGESLEDD